MSISELGQDSLYYYSRLDNAVGEFLARRCQCPEEAQRQAFAQQVKDLSAALGRGDSCIQVSMQQRSTLLLSGLVTETTRQNATDAIITPLVLEDNRLYFSRYWQYERHLAESISHRIKHPPSETGQLPALLEKYFAPDDTAGTGLDWQQEAARTAVKQSFTMITGGPGTGKTTTILKILAILQEISAGRLNIALAAPTGKAAMRLQESLRHGKQQLALAADLAEAIPDTVSTIHRLLGTVPDSVYFKHHVARPLVHDLVVIDEASMVDLALMSKLLDALKKSARLLLVGDKDQLASVESGAVLNDLSAALPAHTAELKKSWRFNEAIKQLATAINQQDAQTAWHYLTDTRNTTTALVSQPLLAHIMHVSQAYFDCVQQQQQQENSIPDAVFKAFSQFQVLCSNRRGQRGVDGINRHIERALQHQGVNTQQNWYAGKPILITRNDPATQLFNGDIGICLPGEPDPSAAGKRHWYVYFQQADGSYRRLLPARLPVHETAYALTIHKSQGSEFEHVLVVLPEAVNPVLGKELIYTAITRARKKVEIASSKEVFVAALKKQVQRNSGLREKMRVYLENME